MFSTKTRCPICRSAKVRKPRGLAQGALHRECYCGACGIRFRLPLLSWFFNAFSSTRPMTEARSSLLTVSTQQTLTPAFSPRTNYQPCLERTSLHSAESHQIASLPPPPSQSAGLHLICAGKTFHFDFRIGNSMPFSGSADSSLSRLHDVVRARWQWINDKTNPRRP